MQLTLPVQLPVEKQLSNFVAGPNVALIEQAAAFIEGLVLPEHHFQQLFLHGGTASGKSHLLYALCHFANERNIEHYYLTLSDCTQYPPALLQGFRDIPLLCIDDVDGISSDRNWQIAIFDLINQRREIDHGLLIFASTKNISQPECDTMSIQVLPDLVSRLQWGQVYQLHALSDDDKRELLIRRAALKGMKFSDKAISYLLNHCERSTQILVDTIERLDQRSLREQRALTVDLIKRELGL